MYYFLFLTNFTRNLFFCSFFLFKICFQFFYRTKSPICFSVFLSIICNMRSFKKKNESEWLCVGRSTFAVPHHHQQRNSFPVHVTSFLVVWFNSCTVCCLLFFLSCNEFFSVWLPITLTLSCVTYFFYFSFATI